MRHRQINITVKPEDKPKRTDQYFGARIWHMDSGVLICGHTGKDPHKCVVETTRYYPRKTIRKINET